MCHPFLDCGATPPERQCAGAAIQIRLIGSRSWTWQASAVSPIPFSPSVHLSDRSFPTLMAGSNQQLFMLVFPHLFSAFFDDTAQPITPFPIGYPGRICESHDRFERQVHLRSCVYKICASPRSLSRSAEDYTHSIRFQQLYHHLYHLVQADDT